MSRPPPAVGRAVHNGAAPAVHSDLALYTNHGHAFEAVREHFEHTCFSLGSGGRPAFDAFEESHGRLVRRRVFLGSSAARGLEALAGWPELRAVLAVETIRSIAGTSKVE